MKYTMNFGRLAGHPPRAKAGDKAFRMAILGDFSGRANAGKIESGAVLAGRKPWRVDIDNFDSVLSRIGLRLRLPIATDGGAVEVAIGSMEDFHPDQLYQKVEIFGKLAGLRQRLKNTSTFPAAAQEMRSWPAASTGHELTPVRAKSHGTRIPRGKLDDFAQLIGRSASTCRATPVDELLKRIVASHVIPAPDAEQKSLVAAVDESLSESMRQMLHNPNFQAIESIWRSVELLVRTVETSPHLTIELYDITAEEFAADLSASESLESTGIYNLLVEKPFVDGSRGPLSVLLANYMFEMIPPHAELLGRIGKIAAAAQAPFIAGISTNCLNLKDVDEVHPLVTESWSILRSMPHSQYLGLTVPRFMLRWPYGAKTEPIESFRFEEFTQRTGLAGMLWANGSTLVGALLGATFNEQGLSAMDLGSNMVLGDIPFYYYTDEHDDQIALPSTERWVSEPLALHAMSQNLMPVLCLRGRPEIRLGSFGSLYGPQLAGPWNPVTVAEFAAQKSEEAVDSEDEPAASRAEVQTSSHDSAVQDVARTSDDSEVETQAATVDASSSSGTVDDLDSLLADLVSNEAEQNGEGGEIDADLAALLADL